MTDIEKVKKDLKECLSASWRGFRPKLYCPHSDEDWDIMRDALSVIEGLQTEIERLKEQEAVEPKTGHWICGKYDDIFMCSSCERYSMDDYPYCHWCGAKMKQEGR